MAGDGKRREGWVRITFDVPAETERDLRIWAAETDRNRGELIRTELVKTLNRRKKRAQT